MHLANCGGYYVCGQPHRSGPPAVSSALDLLSGPLVEKERSLPLKPQSFLPRCEAVGR